MAISVMVGGRDDRLVFALGKYTIEENSSIFEWGPLLEGYRATRQLFFEKYGTICHGPE